MSRRLSLVLVLACATPLAAQQPFDWYGRGPYRAAVPRPDSLLGHPLGTRHTMYHEQQRVLDRLVAAAPERVRTEIIGSTAEGKVMRVLIISAPENLARLDQIRADLAALADPRATNATRAAEIARNTPAVALLSHSIHGNEPAGFEAVMHTAFQLLASDEPATLEILRNVVTILNPSQNPDGHERFAAWNNSVAVASDDPGALEQTEPWSIWGRFNHYRFDMNRDFVAQSQLETRALIGVMVRWNPQLVVDLHSTTDQYFFPPTADPLNKNLGPWQRKWEERFGRGNATAFDRHGWQYYNRDIFDFFYPGYVDAWPSFSGATGMTFETDGGPELRLRKNDGTVTTFADGIAHHFVASMATLGVLAEGRAERLADYHEFRASGMAEVRNRPMKRVVFASSGDPARALQVARLLARSGVEVTRTDAPFTSATAHDYMGGAAARRTFPAGSYVVDLAQPQARLATAMLEPRAVLDSAFARRQLDRYERNRRRGEQATTEGYEFYDVTAWSIPLTFGVDAAWTEDTPAVQGTRVMPDATLPAGSVSGRAQSAYVFPGGQESSTRLALYLLREGFTVGAASQPVQANGSTWPTGTFVVRVQRNGPTLHDRIRLLADSVRAQVTAVQSAFSAAGVGVGSESVRPLKVPKILLAAGDGVGQTSFGAAWHYLERELQYPVVPVDLGNLGRVNLADYNVLVLPEGSGATMLRRAGDAERIKRWVREGGAIITFGGASGFLTAREMALTTVSEVGRRAEADSAKDTTPRDTVLSPTARPGPPVVSPTAPDSARPESVPGIIARATLDRTHWLTYGYTRDHLPVPVGGGAFLKPSRRGDNPVSFLGDTLALSGFVWPGNTERLLKGAIWAAVENVGSGKVVLFGDDPLFRAFWRGTAGLFNNALLMAPGR
ncbi:MAG TPA: M14 family zinc carboxypeptidase [Gemmatimonadaceae bacterium]|nr:M14 family zinc carboxypeptidase [Gemmatimonadaceae bacterium]